MQETINYLKKLTSIVSPTGYTKEISDYLVEELERLGYNPIRTNKGGVNVVVKGKDDSKHRVVTAHVDTLGAMVRAVKPDGRLKLAKVGGYPWNMHRRRKLSCSCSKYRKNCKWNNLSSPN